MEFVAKSDYYYTRIQSATFMHEKRPMKEAYTKDEWNILWWSSWQKSDYYYTRIQLSTSMHEKRPVKEAYARDEWNLLWWSSWKKSNYCSARILWEDMGVWAHTRTLHSSKKSPENLKRLHQMNTQETIWIHNENMRNIRDLST